MLLYTEEQLDKAYKAYVINIPMGAVVLSIEDFRGMMEESPMEIFEGLIQEHDDLKLTTH